MSCSSPARITQGDTFPDMNDNIVSWSYITLECFYFKYWCSNCCLSFHEKNHEMTFDLRLSYNFQQSLKWLQTMFFHSYYRFIQSDNFSNGDYKIKLSINSVKKTLKLLHVLQDRMLNPYLIIHVKITSTLIYFYVNFLCLL